jgi:hypothetical protein
MRPLSPFLKALPLCCGLFFMMAANDECTIRIIVDGDDRCEDVASVCPLDCPLAQNDDGCEICRCAGGGEGEGEGEGECASDSDCRDGQLCALERQCPDCVFEDPPCEIACEPKGRCIDVGPDPCLAVLCAPNTICVADDRGQAQCIPINRSCRSDDQCGPNAFCDFSECGAGRPDGSGDFVQCDTGVCREVPPLSCANVLCAPNTRCVETSHGPQCVPDGSQCEADRDCGPNARCEIICGTDPNCPECDACFWQGICVEQGCPALCGPGSECVIGDDGEAHCEPLREPECMSDGECREGTRCNAADVCLPDPACVSDGSGLVACPAVCWGYCVAPEPQSCTDDRECSADERCEERTTCLACDDPNGGCFAPCLVEGFCVAR